jgi:hypothetical protein
MRQVQNSLNIIPAEASNPVSSRTSGPPLKFIPAKAGTRVTPFFEFCDCLYHNNLPHSDCKEDTPYLLNNDKEWQSAGGSQPATVLRPQEHYDKHFISTCRLRHASPAALAVRWMRWLCSLFLPFNNLSQRP